MSFYSRLTCNLSAFAARRPSATGLACAGLVGFLAYLTVFLITRTGAPLWINLSSAVINAVSATVLAAGFIAVLRARVIDRSPAVQGLAHAGLAVLYCYGWYLIVIILNGIRGGSLTEGFEVNPFTSAALTWQIFQGFTIYAVVALGAYVLHYRQALAAARAQAARPAPSGPAPEISTPARKVMVRGADGLISLDFDDVLYVRAAGDGASIVTRNGAHETRKTLTALMALLPEGRFIRAHRSILVNREAILAAEPAGDGRLTLHFPAGESIITSRTGARAVREAAV